MDTAMEALVTYTSTWDDADTVDLISISSSDIGSSTANTVFQSYSGQTSYLAIFYDGMADATYDLAWECTKATI